MSLSTTGPRTATERDLLYFMTPQLWPLHPFLPIVRYKTGGEMNYGVVYNRDDDSRNGDSATTVYLTNLFNLPTTEAELFALPHETFDSIQAMAQAGWVVD